MTEDDHSPRSDIKQTTPGRLRRRDRRPNRYDYDDVIDARYESDNRMRGDHPSYRGMPNYDPYMQMLPNRFDMRMDPYMMPNAGYGGFHGYNGMMYGPNAGMPRMDRFDDRRRDGVDWDIDREKYSSKCLTVLVQCENFFYCNFFPRLLVSVFFLTYIAFSCAVTLQFSFLCCTFISTFLFLPVA